MSTPTIDVSHLQDDKQARAKTWFDSLRDRICAEFERLEDEAPSELYPGEPGRFELTDWRRIADVPFDFERRRG